VIVGGPVPDMTGADRFEAFVRRHQDMVFATALRLLGNRSEAEDIAQSVFFRAFQRFAEIGDSPAAAGWLKTVARNACLNHLARYRSRWRLFSELGKGEDSDDERFESTPAVGESPLGRMERADQQARIDRALQGLPDHQRVPIVLFHLDEMSYQEIADLLGASLGKVKTDIHRGRLALRKKLESDGPL
jgi:RNA polymerase sigma-70 factor, ECF subfamily